jgi:hypothetical protein
MIAKVSLFLLSSSELTTCINDVPELLTEEMLSDEDREE